MVKQLIPMVKQERIRDHRLDLGWNCHFISTNILFGPFWKYNLDPMLVEVKLHKCWTINVEPITILKKNLQICMRKLIYVATKIIYHSVTWHANKLASNSSEETPKWRRITAEVATNDIRSGSEYFGRNIEYGLQYIELEHRKIGNSGYSAKYNRFIFILWSCFN